MLNIAPRLCLAIGTFLIFAGCGSGNPEAPKTALVTGVVTLDDQPLSGVSVSFQPEGTAIGGPSMGITDASGKYELTYDGSTKGAVIGSHKVRVSTPTNAPTPPGTKHSDPIPAIYNTKTTLTKTVEAGPNTIDLTLTSK